MFSFAVGSPPSVGKGCSEELLGGSEKEDISSSRTKFQGERKSADKGGRGQESARHKEEPHVGGHKSLGASMVLNSVSTSPLTHASQ